MSLAAPRRSFWQRSAGAALLCAATLAAAGCGSTAGSRGPRGPGSVAGDAVAAVRPLVEAAAQRHGVPPELVLGIIQIESRFQADRRSAAGARGLMQLMPRTAASLARRLNWPDYDPEDPAFNVEAGTAFLAYLLRIFDGDVRLALAAYNSGPARVKRLAREHRPLPAYSRRYVAAVLAARGRFLAPGSAGGPPPARDEAGAPDEPPTGGLDRTGLRTLIRDRQLLYGPRPDESLPDD